MRFRSTYSGIEAASVAWLPLGWECVSVAEIDPFACAVLSHHYPGVPNLGDMSKAEAEPGTTDVVVGGSPCQSFSVAGKRLGLDDPRGNMALHFLRFARGSRAPWMVFENVPGLLSSSRGEDFAAFLSAATGWDVPVPPGGWLNSGVGPRRTVDDYSVAWRILDAQYFGLAQRRKRVFVVGRLGDWRGPAAVLLERDGMSGNPPPGREAGAGVAGSLTGSLGRRGGQPDGGDTEGQLIVAADVTGPLTSNYFGDHESRESLLIAHSLRADGFDASEDGTGRGTPLVPVAYNIIGLGQQGRNHAYETEVSGCLQHKGLSASGNEAGTLLAYQCHGNNVDPMGTIRSGNAGLTGGVPFVASYRTAGNCGPFDQDDKVACLNTATDPNQNILVIHSAVRRLTPRECERLQGFEDDWTLVPYRGKPASDGPRYRAIGNSFPVPVLTWLGEGIEVVASLSP